jgi:hypothetical protein
MISMTMVVAREGWLDRRVLPRNATLRLPRPGRGAVVEVEHGLVIVTRQGDTEDHVLESGMAVTLCERGLAVAWALAPSTVRVRWAGTESLPAMADIEVSLWEHGHDHHNATCLPSLSRCIEAARDGMAAYEGASPSQGAGGGPFVTWLEDARSPAKADKEPIRIDPLPSFHGCATSRRAG